MRKLLKVLFAIEFILIIVIIVLSFIETDQVPTGYIAKDINTKENLSIENTNFKIFTKAVCEEKSDHIFCSDRLFVKCNGKEYLIENDLENFTKCNNAKINLSDSKVIGHIVLTKDWTDPRKY